jgi:hypothetical protein
MEGGVRLEFLEIWEDCGTEMSTNSSLIIIQKEQQRCADECDVV